MEDRCHIYCVFVLIFSYSVICDDCVTFDFEKDFNSTFSNELGVCVTRLMWNVGYYENLKIDGPDPSSMTYIYPNDILSCASSFTFSMTANGIIEVNLFMEPTSPSDQVTILANQIVVGGNDAVVGNVLIIATDQDFVSGWRTARMTLSGFGTYNGYISILGMAVKESIVLVDSFRYIPPLTVEEECTIYEKVYTTSTTITTEAETISTSNSES
nr:uncharacterized protein LOC113398664 [Vanessa tameamea]